jgi:hypothetical protein
VHSGGHGVQEEHLPLPRLLNKWAEGEASPFYSIIYQLKKTKLPPSTVLGPRVLLWWPEEQEDDVATSHTRLFTPELE